MSSSMQPLERPQESFKSFEVLDKLKSTGEKQEEKVEQKQPESPQNVDIPVKSEHSEVEHLEDVPKSEEESSSDGVEQENKEEDNSAEEESDSEPEDDDKNKKIEWVTKSGKKYEATIQELQNSWSLYDENKKRLSEFDKKNKELEKEVQKAKQFDEFTSRISSLEGNNLLQSVLEEAQRINPKTEAALQEYYNKVFKEVELISRMSPQERETYELKKRASFYENQEKDRINKEKSAQAEKLVNRRLEEIKKTWEVDDSLIERAYSLALEKSWVKQTTSPEEALKVIDDIVAEYSFEQRAASVLKKIGVDETNSEALEDLISFQFRNRKAGKKEIESRARTLFAPPEQKPQPKPKPKQKQEQKPMTILRGNQMPEGSRF